MKVTPRLLKLMLNLYPPYLGTGIKIKHISEDWREIHTSLSLRWFNRNAVGTHFGGSIFAMVDPHIMLLLIRLLGKEYWVWDKSAEIEFIKASSKTVTSTIKISRDDLETIKRRTDNGEKYLPEFVIEIKDDDNLSPERLNRRYGISICSLQAYK